MKSKPFAITLDVGSSLLNKTGSWRTERPVYLDRLPPCNNACPAGENIQHWLFLAEEGRYEEAWRQIMEDNPFPAIMGRVCYMPCERACNRGHLDESVGINSVERFLGDQGLMYQWKVESGPDTGKKVMIVGAGPGGLSAAYHLRRIGHHVTVFEASAKAGGLIRYGIPKYRMPREKLNGEIRRIEEMGVEIRCNARIDDILETRDQGGFDAVILALGAPSPRRADIPQEGEGVVVLNALDVLREVELEEPTAMRGHVVAQGGGNTAMDVARSAVRLGCPAVTVLVRRDRTDMTAHPMEIHEAVEEGVDIKPLRVIKEISGRELRLEVNLIGEDRRPVATGELETMEADVVVQALGQVVEEDLLSRLPGLEIRDGVVTIDRHMMSGAEGVFCLGDMVPSARTVTVAIGQGKKAARNVDAWLRGEVYQAAPKHEVADYGMLNNWYYTDAPRTVRPMLDLMRRQSGFAEVVGNLNEENAKFEARRCLSCGNCFECDNCYGICPDNAITKLGPGERFEFKYDYCKGCGMCAAECPCGAIRMEPEEI
ncbi:MAG: NAD(P)-binding protein [Chromatiaceae bacterium]|jgi:NADPH-dependent glutamate synthase beta subunit-like oxidoreductase|nr:NAD(P)-binding protein [Chromatiaceae bacterium]